LKFQAIAEKTAKKNLRGHFLSYARLCEL